MPNVSFTVAATQIGMQLGLITKATGAALIAAGLLSVLILPLLALTLLRRTKPTPLPAFPLSITDKNHPGDGYKRGGRRART